MPKSFRFWIHWKGSPVRLTLTAKNTESKSVCFRHWERTGEGWSSETHFYWLETEYDPRRGASISVHFLLHTDGRDCDGRLSQTTEWSCPTHRLQIRHPEADESSPGYGILWPEWKKMFSSQRDYSAEAMNY